MRLFMDWHIYLCITSSVSALTFASTPPASVLSSGTSVRSRRLVRELGNEATFWDPLSESV
jgi:hypothetical protein